MAKQPFRSQALNEDGAPKFTVAQETLKAAFDIDFAKRLEDTFTDEHPVVGSVVKGVVVHVDTENVLVDIGLKSEGRIPLKEFEDFETGAVSVKVGDLIEVFVENLDDRHAMARLSREKARREEVLTQLEGAQKAGQTVKGVIFGKVKGGFMVDVQGVLGFLPGSQLDAKPITDVNPFMYIPLEFQVVKLDRKRNNLIVSRRALTEGGEGSAGREELLAGMKEGSVVKGTVKNITDYGAFLDLGGLDGLLHITDIAWHRINHPGDVLKVGQTIDVMVVRFDEKTQRVSLGLKQLRDDPWLSVDKQFPIGGKVEGKITNLTDYGAFVELAPGVEGLIHVSEMSWTRKNIHPSKVVQPGQVVNVQVLEIDRDKRRISLGLKQTQENPWETFARTIKVGDKVTGSVRSTTDFGVFVALTEEIDGLVHVSDLSWDQSGEEALRGYKKGDKVEAVVLAVDTAKERVALGIKQLAGDPLSSVADTYKKGDVVDVKITDVDSESITVSLDGMEATIKARDLGVSRDEQTTARFKEGETIKAKVTMLSKKDRKLSLSVRALEQDEERATVKAYANQKDEGDSALAEALKKAGAKAAAKPKAEKAEKAPAKKAAAKADDSDAEKPAKKAPAKKAKKAE
ncbi:MAG TPA: 30S ribosomal protein S1 [Alphaproteobacteria bacterium]|nr:30S ribosomal protein S1 [Alphaproteobacteria bacterium]